MYQTEGQSSLVSLRRCLVLICSLLGLIRFLFSGEQSRHLVSGLSQPWLTQISTKTWVYSLGFFEL